MALDQLHPGTLTRGVGSQSVACLCGGSNVACSCLRGWGPTGPVSGFQFPEWSGRGWSPILLYPVFFIHLPVLCTSSV